MSTPSNLYAEKVFSEHPTALWALDDKSDYLNLLSYENRSFLNWSINGANLYTVDSTSSPFSDVETALIVVGPEFQSLGQVSLISDDIFNFNNFNKDLKTFAIGSYFYSNSNTLSSIEFGYEYFDATTGTNVQQLKTFTPSIKQRWFFLSETFEIPSDNTTFRIVAKINYLVLPESLNSPEFFVNGVTLGQWCEEFNSTSLGVETIALPGGLGFDNSDFGIKAYAYGLENLPGYYVVSDNTIKAKNTGVPIVYGAKGITKLLPNNNKPSLIIPGKGFLHEFGKHKEYTFEMWLRVLCDSKVPKRIFGPIFGSDGVYLDGPFITLKINDYSGSYYVGEWGKPMLIDIRYSSTGAALLINGDTAIDISFNSSDLSFPLLQTQERDWLGFWSYDDINPVEIDCVAIYSYQVGNTVAKRRFVYGQGVDFPENINASYSGSSVFIDYQFAKYTNSYVYPDLGKWNQGSRNNINISNNQLSTPEYRLPRLVLSSGSEETFKSFNFNDDYQDSEDSTSFSFATTPIRDNGYLIFDDFNFLQEDIRAFYAVIKPTELTSSDEILLHIDSDATQNYFSIILNGTNIRYVLHYNGVTKTIYTATGIGIGEIFPVGIDIDQFTSFFGQDTSAFFGNRGDLKFYIGGNSKFDKSFHGKFYKVGFCNSENFVEVSGLFNAKGCVLEYEDVFDLYSSNIDYDAGEYTGSDPLFWSFVLDGGSPTDYPSYRLIDHIASYTLFVKYYLSKYYFDIAVSGSWKDYIPLTSLAKYVKDSSGENYYNLDFVQFNIDYPAPSKYIETAGQPVVWKYGAPTIVGDTVIPSLVEEFAIPEQKTYDELDNQLYTGYNDYSDLQNKSSKTYTYDTSGSHVRSYVMFEYVSSGVTTSDSYFSNTQLAPKNGVVSPGAEWINTKYEVVDGITVYPPKEDINNLAMVTKVQFLVEGILTHKIKVKTLEYASQAFNDTSPNAIGTRFGEDIYPYVKNGYYYNYKSKNPFSIYKKSSPYLYLTRNSGICLKGDYISSVERGISIPINKSMTNDFNVVVMQLAMRFDQDFFPYSPMEIFEIESPTSHIKFFMVANSSDGTRARVYAINAKTKKLENGILFYLNGNVVSNPVITVKEWAFLGVQFANMPNFDGAVGSIKLTAPMTYNSISYYKSTTLQEIQQVATRPWVNVKYVNQDLLDWAFWYDDPDHAFQWGNILYVSTVAYYGITPSKIYDTYVGTNKTIIDDGRTLSLGSYEYNLYKDISSEQVTVIPV